MNFGFVAPLADQVCKRRHKYVYVLYVCNIICINRIRGHNYTNTKDPCQRKMMPTQVQGKEGKATM